MHDALSLPVSALAWLGGCGCGVLGKIPALLAETAKAGLRFLKDLLHGILRILRFIGRILITPFRLRKETASQIYTLWHEAKGKGILEKILAVCKMTGVFLLSDHGILVSLFRYIVPVLCCVFLWTVVSYGTGFEYGIAVTLNGKPIGMIEQESDYMQAEQIVRRRLSFTEEDLHLDFSRSLKLEINDGSTEMLSAGTLADKMLEAADISICTGYGVYVNDEFYGAVEDYHPIEDALKKQLSDVSNQFNGEVDDLHYADTVTYEQGIYLASSLVNANRIADKLTSFTRSERTYTAGEFETVDTVMERFSITEEELLELNPSLKGVTVIPHATRLTVPVITRFMPIVFKRTITTLSLIDYDTVEIETNTLPIGKQTLIKRGEKGEKRNFIQVTYTDGAESTRSLLYSQLLEEPVDEEIGVGTYAPKPASENTVLAGSGRFSWPLDGGRISDHFGGARNHRGIDLAAPLGTNIYAADDGVVRVAGLNSSYGYYIIVDHQDGTETLYAHSSLLLVTVGQEVKRGQVIALVGSTGHSTGPHLHFEVRIGGINFDPAMFLRVNVD